MTPPQKITARLEEKIVWNEKFVQFQFELVEPHTFQFQAGQYVSVQVLADGTRRSYSIISRPDIDHGFELLVDVEKPGLGADFFTSLEFGNTISIMAPLGRFVIEPNPAEQAVVLIATGSGIAPYRSMLMDQLQVKGDTRPYVLYWGLRYAQHLIWEDEFEELAENFPNFKFHPVISQPIPEWVLCRGRVTDCLVGHPLPENAGYYVCGSSQMITDVKGILAEHNIPETSLHQEKFF